MRRSSTIFLRGAVLFMGLVVVSLCIVVLPAALNSDETGFYPPILLGMYGTAAPFFIAEYYTLKLLGYIDKNQAFSHASVEALRYIKYCAFTVSGFYTAALPYIYIVAKQDDAPGIIVIGFIFAFASMVIAVLAAVLQKLLENAIAIKSENDLTI